MHAPLRYLRHAARTLSRVPAFAAMAVLLPSLGADLEAPCGSAAVATPTAVAGSDLARPAAMPIAATAVGELPKTEFSIVTPEYFRASGVRLVRGRMFDAADRADGPQVVIVNEALVRRYWPDEDPIGQVIRLDAAADDELGVEREVVGVVTNARPAAQLDADASPAVYLPLAQSPYPFL